MDTDKVFSLLSFVLAVIAVAIGIYSRDGITTVTAVLALSFSILTLKYTPRYSKLVLTSSLVVLLCTASMATITSYDYLVNDDRMSRQFWIYFSSLIYSLAIVPLIFVFYLLTAYLFKASYNWVMVGGLMTFIGMGMIVPGYTMVYIFYWNTMDPVTISVASTSIGLMVNVLVFLTFGLTLGYIFKKHRYLLNDNGIVVRQ